MVTELISCMLSNGHFIDMTLVRHLDDLLPLLQSAFLQLDDDLVITHGFAPLPTPTFQYNPCLFKGFVCLPGTHKKAEDISFSVLNRSAAGVIQIGNLCLDLSDLPILIG